MYYHQIKTLHNDLYKVCAPAALWHAEAHGLQLLDFLGNLCYDAHEQRIIRPAAQQPHVRNQIRILGYDYY